MKCEACGKDNVEGARFCASCGALLPAEKAGTDPLIGQLVGSRYRVTGVLGEGGMGVVYVGEQQMGSTVRKVAIKTLHQHLSKDPSVLARFHRECGTVAQLEHPNTIKVYDFGSTGEGTLYIAMEFVAGKPLNDIIEKEGALPPERVLKILRQVCGALDEAHRQGVIHRDLKPENIILAERAGETDFVKVLDFGIAARSESADAQKEQKLTQQGMVLGTPPYMSPEQFTGKALDRRSDVYSLGVMAYEMLTARLPFAADTPWQWATQHMTAQPMPFETALPGRELPPGMRQAILRALAKERTDRQETAQAFFEELSNGGAVAVAGAASTASTGTAAMEASPGFSAAEATARTAAMPEASAAAGAGSVLAAAVQATPGAMIAAPPLAHGRKSSGKGLIVGLGLVGAVLLVAIVVVSARELGSEDDEPTAPLALNEPPSTTVTATTPAADPVENPEPTPEIPTASPPTQPGTGTKPGSGTPKKPGGTTPKDPGTGKPDAGTADKPGTGTPKDPGTGTPPDPKPDPDRGASAACDACLSKANAGDYGGAATKLAQCTDATQKSKCAFIIKQKAGKAAIAAAKNGDCATAKALAAAAAAAGSNVSAALKKAGCV